MSRAKLRSILYGSAIVLAGGLLFAGFGITVAPDAGTRLSGASMVAALGDFDAALAMCDKVLQEHPDNVDARVYRATFLAQAERFDEALVAYEDASRHADDPALRRSLAADRASVLLHAGRESEYRDARAALAKGGVDRYVHMLDGVAARHDRRWAAAEAAFRRALAEASDGGNARSLLVSVIVSRARDELAAGRFQASIDAYGVALAEDAERADIVIEAAEAHLAAKQEAAAIALLEKLDAKTRGVAPLLFRAATAMLERGDRTGALKALTGAAAVDVKAVQALYETDPAWVDVRKATPFAQIVSKRDGDSGAGLPGSEAVIGSGR